MRTRGRLGWRCTCSECCWRPGSSEPPSRGTISVGFDHGFYSRETIGGFDLSVASVTVRVQGRPGERCTRDVRATPCAERSDRDRQPRPGPPGRWRSVQRKLCGTARLRSRGGTAATPTPRSSPAELRPERAPRASPGPRAQRGPASAPTSPARSRPSCSPRSATAPWSFGCSRATTRCSRPAARGRSTPIWT